MNQLYFRGIFCHSFLSQFIVKGEWFYEWFFGISPWMSYSEKKIKANNEKQKIKAFLDCQLGTSFSKLVIH